MKRLLCAVLTAGMAVGAAGAAFTDIAGHWGEQAITQIVERNIFQGTSETTFSPNESMTRAMFVTVLGRCAQTLGFSVEGQAQTPFTDVPSEAYYAPYVAWANANEIVKGIEETRFAPDVAVTREQMCTLLVRFFSYLKLDTASYAPTEVTFADADQISAYASESVLLAHSMGLIQGIPQGDSIVMSPRGAVTRAQVATVIGRVLTETEGKVTPPQTTPTTPEQPNPPSDTNTGGGSATGGGGTGGGGTGGGGATGGGGTGGGGATGGGGTSGGSSNSGTEPTPEQKKEEEKVAGLLTNLLSNYQASRYLETMNQAPKDCAAILMDCIAEALDARKKGQFLTKAWVGTTYQTQIQSFKNAYRVMEKDDKEQLAYLIVGLDTTENIYTIMDFFGVSLPSM